MADQGVDGSPQESTGPAVASPLGPTDPRGTGAKVVRNTLWNTFNFLVTLPIGLYLTPFVINALGDDDYGVWALIGTFISVSALADLGITTALNHFVAKHNARREPEIIDRMVNTAFVVYIAVCTPLLLVLLSVTEPMVKVFFQVPPERIPEISLFVQASLGIFFLRLVMTGYFSAVAGLQRFDVLNATAILFSFISLFGTVWVLSAGHGLTGLVGFNIAQMLLGIVVSWIQVKWFLPYVGFRPWLFNRSDAREILGYSFHIFLGNVSGLIFSQMDKLIIGGFLQVRFVGYYHVATDIVGKARMVPQNLVGPILTAASELHAGGQDGAIRKLYLRSQRYVVLAGLPGFTWLILFARPFVDSWIGPGRDAMILTFQLLSGATAIHMMAVPGAQILAGLKMPQYWNYLGMASVAVNLVFSLGLIHWLGYLAVVLGSGIGLILTAVLFLPRVHAKLGLDLRTVWRECWVQPALAGALTVAVTVLMGLPGMCDSLVKVLLMVPGYSLIYGLALLLAGFPQEVDRALLERHLPGWLAAWIPVRR